MIIPHGLFKIKFYYKSRKQYLEKQFKHCFDIASAGIIALLRHRNCLCYKHCFDIYNTVTTSQLFALQHCFDNATACVQLYFDITTVLLHCSDIAAACVNILRQNGGLLTIMTVLTHRNICLKARNQFVCMNNYFRQKNGLRAFNISKSSKQKSH